MNKLKLSMESLKVETFEAVPVPEQRGTVPGNEVMVSFPNTCADTECGRSFCVSSPCAC
ncbi:hypothetical protein [Longimicrobium terrae]|uniref:Uncharacterized protein n=1 Tax=Longimicrobium terrae TaxID=1639882 RepID=A0A841H2L1_9BACT|nr:hypothetical protein [Longimicrobium terrae]MBB4637702.1 hypothetical protein [Longimicrobium terrae]MBB6072099.1 hypothetical protein [Longimicrobium terrae]NNC29818.1 hypothetical protein [Longimicrobium terrae]